MSKILITGVAGLLGSRLADWIIENKPDVEVWGIDDLSGGYKENVNSKVKFITNNLVKDTDLLSHVFETEKFDYVFHFAAYAAEGLSPFIRTFNYDNNLRATAFIVNECIKHSVKRLVFTSTLAVYGHGNGGIFDESQQQNRLVMNHQNLPKSFGSNNKTFLKNDLMIRFKNDFMNHQKHKKRNLKFHFADRLVL